MNVILALVTVVLVLTCLFMVLVILMQRAKSDGGVGAALGGGMAESAFGGETGNVLSRATTGAAILFFVLAFGLYLGRIHQHRVEQRETPEGLPTLPGLMPATPETLPPVGPDGAATPAGTGVVPADGASLVPPTTEATPAGTATDTPAPAAEAPAGTP